MHTSSFSLSPLLSLHFGLFLGSLFSVTFLQGCLPSLLDELLFVIPFTPWLQVIMVPLCAAE